MTVIGAQAGQDAEALPATTEFAFAGAIKTKLNAQAKPPVNENVHVTTDVMGQFESLTIAPEAAPETGALLVDTTDTATWKAPQKKNATTWTVQTKASSAATAALYLNGQWRPLKPGATLTVKFVGNKTSLYLKLTGFAPTGVGTGSTSVESETSGIGLDSRLYVFLTIPDTGGTIGTQDPILITFSESIDGFDPTGTTITCDQADVPFQSSFSGSQLTLDPDSDLPAGAVCTVTVAMNGPSDADSNDPPTGLEADYSFTFSTDAAPEVTTATPDGTSTVAVNQDFTFDFSEEVNLAAGAYSYLCAPSGDSGTLVGPVAAVMSMTIIGAWTQNDTCTITIHAALVTDTDLIDPPNTMEADYTLTFTVEELAPFVVSTVPANGATNVSTANPTSITFSEPVTLLNGTVWTRYDCGPGFQGDVTWNQPSLGPQTVFTFPGAPIFAGKTCTNTIYVGAFVDEDGNDPPDTMAADYTWTFSYAP